MQQRWGLPIVAWPSRLRPSFWDGVALPLVIGALALIVWASPQMNIPFEQGQQLPISLDPRHLPEYGARTVLRMIAALIVSLAFSLAYAAVAAKSKRAEKLLVPILDVLQSVPILGFEAIAIAPFIGLFPGNLLGYECAAIFAIFTSQAWNMTFSLYQSFSTVPHDLREAARMYHLSAWQSFWQLEVPFAMPQLTWNMMMSVSGGWFFVVASEALTVGENTVTLPGIGSYIKTAIDQSNLAAVGYAILTMLILILIYDQLLFRPLLAWGQRFKFEEIGQDEVEPPWFLIMIQRARIIHLFTSAANFCAVQASRVAQGLPRLPKRAATAPKSTRVGDTIWGVVLGAGALYALYAVGSFVHSEVGWGEAFHVCLLGLATLARVIVLIVLASLVWVPIGVWI